MLRVLAHIESNLDSYDEEVLQLETPAEQSCFSAYHFHRIFRGMIGESVKSYIRRLRLERAATRLRQGREQITVIAFDSGYDSHEVFSRAFRTQFSMPQTHRIRRPQRIDETRLHLSEHLSL